MLTAEENAVLTETGPGAPMGDVFRCYWLPALLCRELPAADCAPVRVTLLGEDYVAFRDSRGRAAIVEARCPHRGANLFFGRNEECGLRCAYHGWKFDAEGNCVDIPNAEPNVAERLKPRAGIRALHVAEAGGVVWAWFGDPQHAPPLPDFEFLAVPPEQRFVSKKFQQCNWAQACEGGLDTAHFSYLHCGIRDGRKVGLHEAGDAPLRRGDNEPESLARLRWIAEDGAPRFSVLRHAAGLLLCAARRTGDERLYWRMTQFLMPNHSLTPGNLPEDTCFANTWMPVDDTSCWIFCYAWHPHRPIGEVERQRLEAGSAIFAEVDDEYVPLSRRENDYRLDRARQRESSFTGIRGISEQDQAIADSQGRIADRSREILCQTDLGVVRFREMALAAARDVAAGRTPPGADRPKAYRVRSGDVVAAADVDVEAVVRERFGEHWGEALP